MRIPTTMKSGVGNEMSETVARAVAEPNGGGLPWVATMSVSARGSYRPYPRRETKGRGVSEKRDSALRLHARRGSRGPLWQHQFWDRFVRHEKEFHERLEYMHLNPARKGSTKRPQDWRSSSYNHYASDPATVAACPIQIDYVSLPVGYRA